MLKNNLFKNAENNDCSSATTTSTDLSGEDQSDPTSVKNATRSKIKEVVKEETKEKKKKKKKAVSICLTNCRYEIIRKVAQKFTLKEVSEGDNWNMYWTDLSISIERCKEMKRFQRINHFPGAFSF